MSSAASKTLTRDQDKLVLAAVERGICAIGTCRNIVVIVWWGSATGPAVERLAQITARMRDTHPEKVSHIHLVRDRAGFPNSDARNAFVKIMREHADGIANCAAVVGGTGFWASTMRSAITSMRLLSPRSFEMRLHGTSAEMLEWLPDAHELRTTVPLAPQLLRSILDQAEHWLRVDVPTVSNR